MGYEVTLQKDILALLQLFHERVPDRETHGWVTELARDRRMWPRAYDIFKRIRNRLLEATGDAGRPPVRSDQIDEARVCQYYFEEVCLQSLFNETDTDCPFDACSSYWIAPNAIHLARTLGVPLADVIAIIAPQR